MNPLTRVNHRDQGHIQVENRLKTFTRLNRANPGGLEPRHGFTFKIQERKSLLSPWVRKKPIKVPHVFSHPRCQHLQAPLRLVPKSGDGKVVPLALRGRDPVEVHACDCLYGLEKSSNQKSLSFLGIPGLSVASGSNWCKPDWFTVV